VQLGLKVA